MAAPSSSVVKYRRPEAIADLGRSTSALFHIFGTDLARKSNFALIEDEIAVYAVGNSLVFENLVNGFKSYLMGLDDGGVGCVAVHPSR